MQNWTNLRKALVIIGAIIIFLLLLILTAKEPKGTAQISWNSSSDSNLGGYKIYYGTSPRNADCPPADYSDNIAVGNSTFYTFGDLAINKTYYFSVTAYNTSGQESCFSDEVSKTISVSQDTSSVSRFIYFIRSKIKISW